VASISYRPFSGADWENVFLFLDKEEQSVEHPLDVLAHHPVDAWLALDADRLIGWVLTRAAMSDDGLQRGFIEDLVVARDHRGQGIGKQLVELAEKHYRQLGFSGMQLTVRADNQPANHLYTSMGYEPVQDRVRMWKAFLVG